MGKLTEKEIIRTVIEMHQQVILSGGVSHRTWFLSLLSRRQHSLLRIFKLPATKENLLTTITYPCSQTIDSLFDEALCRQAAGFFQYKEQSKNIGLSKNINKADDGSLIDIQVGFVYESLLKLAAMQQKTR